MKKEFLLLFLSCAFVQVHSQQIKVSYPASIHREKFSGHVLLYLSKENRTPITGMVGLEIFPCFAMQVKNIAPGQTVTFTDAAVSYPASLSNIERGEYYVQAVWDRNLGGRSIAASEGNLYSNPQKINLTKDYKKVFTLLANKKMEGLSFNETDFTKELKAPSKLLSDFHSKKMTVDAAVVLPKDYFKDSTKKYPVLFEVFGYGGDYHEFSGSPISADPLDTIPVIRVYLDGNCALGHSVYANSQNNGPWGDALTKEFIPALEKQFRCNGARLLGGHSSGGFSVLWLQTHYPTVFAGCSSSAPDPVDFRSFGRVNLYEDKNMFYDKDSALNKVATIAGYFPWAYLKNIYQAENVVYRGEQIHSFDAVFSQKDKTGEPARLCNAATGVQDTLVRNHWKQYDISLYLRNNWSQLKPSLQDKVRVSVGNQDNFLLNYAVKLLDAEMKKLNSGFQFAYYPGDHFTVATKQYRKDGTDFLKARYLEWLKTSGMESK